MLRNYQVKAINDVFKAGREGNKRVLLVAPTGAGKTVIAGKIIEKSYQAGKKVMFIVHRDILVTQTKDKLSSLFGVNEVGVIAGKYKESRQYPIQVASIQTLSRRDISWFKPDCLIFDEAHTTSWSSWALKQFPRLDHLEEEDLESSPFVIGLTATPWRLKKGESMGDIFETLVQTPAPKQLIDMGYLVRPICYAAPTPDLEGIKTVRGDYDLNDLDHICNVPEVIDAGIRDWQRLAAGRRTIAFAVNVSHAEAIAERFIEAGVPATYVSANTKREECYKAYDDLAEGRIKVLASCMKLSEGFDVPSVSCVLMSRPTKSKSLYVQQLGRGLRISKETGKQDCIVLDQGGNIKQHGFVEDITGYDLEPMADEKGEGDAAPVRNCPQCFHICYNFNTVCPNCGYEFPLDPEKTVKPTEAMVLALDSLGRRKCKQYRGLLKKAYELKYNPGWAYREYKRRNNTTSAGQYIDPPWDWHRHAVFGEDFTDEDVAQYIKYLNKHRRSVSDWLRLEFGKL